MAHELLDWTFAEIPNDDAPAGTKAIVTRIKTPAGTAAIISKNPAPARLAGARPGSGAQPHRQARRWARPALLLAGLLAALGVMVLGAGQAGWRRIEQQVTQAVLYEDAQARAGQVDRVLAAQVPADGAWLAQRRQEARLGQPGPNPAPQLRLSPLPPEVIGLTATFANEVQATVVRTYADAAGRQYRFEFTQTYNSAQPGIWLRQPADTRPLQARAAWTGARLTAAFPLADQAWMSATLPMVDSDLETACAGQGCAEGVVAPLVFSNRLPLPASTADQIVLLSPHLAGWPHDEAASQALREAITARTLIFLAGQAAPGDLDGQARWLAGAEAALGGPVGLDEAVEATRTLAGP